MRFTLVAFCVLWVTAASAAALFLHGSGSSSNPSIIDIQPHSVTTNTTVASGTTVTTYTCVMSDGSTCPPTGSGFVWSMANQPSFLTLNQTTGALTTNRALAPADACTPSQDSCTYQVTIGLSGASVASIAPTSIFVPDNAATGMQFQFSCTMSDSSACTNKAWSSSGVPSFLTPSVNATGLLLTTNTTPLADNTGTLSVTAQGFTQSVSWTVGPVGPVAVMNPNNPTSATSMTDSFGAVWTFNKSITSGCGSDPIVKSLDCEGDWPLLRNGTANDPTGSNAGIWQLRQVSGDPNLYAYNMQKNMWYSWNNTAWMQIGSAPVVSNTTAIPFLFEMLQWVAYEGSPGNIFTTTNTGFLNRIPDSFASEPQGPQSNYFICSGCYNSAVPNIPQDITYDWGTCVDSGTPTACTGSPSAFAATGSSGSTTATISGTAPTGIVGWMVNPHTNPYPFAASGVVVTGLSGNTVTFSAPLNQNISSGNTIFLSYAVVATGSSGSNTVTLSGPVPIGIGGAVSGWAVNQFATSPFPFPDQGTVITAVNTTSHTLTFSENLNQSISSQVLTLQNLPDWAGLAAGTYDNYIKGHLQTYILPHAAQLYYVRFEHEWNGNWYLWSPYFQSDNFHPRVPPSVWAPATGHMMDLFAQYVVTCGSGCNPNIKFELDSPSHPATSDASYLTYTGTGFATSLGQKADLLGTDDYSGAQKITSGPPQTAADYWAYYSQSHSDFATYSTFDRGYVATVNQSQNKPAVWPETGLDTSIAPDPGGYAIKAYLNFFASQQGPGNAKVVATAYWNTDNGGGGTGCCLVTDYPGKKAQLAQTYPSGVYGTHYDGSYFTQITVPSPNFWNGSLTAFIPTGISFNPNFGANITVSHTATAYTFLTNLCNDSGTQSCGASTRLSMPSGAYGWEGITTSNTDLFFVGTDAVGLPPGQSGGTHNGVQIWLARNLTSADVGTHTTSICAAEAPTICATLTLTVN